MNDEDVSKAITLLHEKLDRILFLLEETRAARVAKSSARTPKPKSPPLTEEEINMHQARFSSLFSRWMQGHELEVQDELEQLDVEQLRRFGDANNLNVTSKMPKQKLLQLIGARFREKRQLHRGSSARESGAT